MNFELSDEQVMLRDAAADALSRLDTVASGRAALDGDELVSLWPTAREAGWTGLLIGDEHGGAGLGPFDAMLVLEECGRRLTGAGLIGHLTATRVLATAGAGDLEALATGDRRAALAPLRPPIRAEGHTAEAPAGERRGPAPVAELDGASATVTGAIGFACDLAGADDLVVGARTPGGEVVAVLLSPSAPGVSVEPVLRYDATRPLGHVRLEGATGAIVARGSAELDDAWYLGQALLAADALGVCRTMLDMGVEYAQERHAFGRPIGSYQAVKHQLVEILRHIDKTRNLCYYAGFAAENGEGDWPLAASCARYTGEVASDYAVRTCIAVHGGIGATWEHDAPFFWRRSQLSRLLLGGRSDASDRVAAEILEKAREFARTTEAIAA